MASTSEQGSTSGKNPASDEMTSPREVSPFNPEDELGEPLPIHLHCPYCGIMADLPEKTQEERLKKHKSKGPCKRLDKFNSDKGCGNNLFWGSHHYCDTPRIIEVDPTSGPYDTSNWANGDRKDPQLLTRFKFARERKAKADADAKAKAGADTKATASKS